MKLFLLVLLVLQLCEGETTSCSQTTTTTRESKPLYLLTLVPFPDPRDGTGWDGGLGTISGARVARDEINNRTDLLPGYHIELIVDNIEACSLTEAGTGLVNLVKYTVSPPCHPVVALIGLLCSSHTSIVSPVAGHEGFDLIQISGTNSPIIQAQNYSYPHLWRFLGSSAVYVDTALAIMDQFNWQRIGVVYDAGSVFHTEIAKYFEQRIMVSRNKILVFDVGISGTRTFYFDHILSNLRHDDVTILFVSLNKQQTSILLSRTFDEGFNYPDYTWILVETSIDLLIKENVIEKEKVYKASRGHIHLFVQTKPQNESEILVSGESYSTFKTKYEEDLEGVKEIYSGYSIDHSLTSASYLYDEVWAFALAMNNSLPVLDNRNLSIDNYTIGQPEITTLIGEHMANLSFQGASGFVEFNQYRSVSTPVEVFWVSGNNGTGEMVGIYNPKNSSDFSVYINPNDLPSGNLRRELQLVLIPLPVAILLYILAGVVIIFTTVQLFFYLHYRDHKAIKATSPYLSLLMFAGCYLFCLAAILNMTYGSFGFSPSMFTALLCLKVVITVNAFSLILVTLFIKLLRVYWIFFSRLKMDLGSCWSNCPLFLIITVLCILPNIITAFSIIFETPEYHSYTHEFRKGQLTIVIEKHIVPHTKDKFAAIGVVFGYFLLFLLLICSLAILTRKIKYSNFKDTKKINIFIVVLIFTIFLIIPLYLVRVNEEDEPGANISLITGMLFIPLACQLILFLPKVLPVVLEEYFPRALDSFNSFLFTTQQKRLSLYS